MDKGDENVGLSSPLPTSNGHFKYGTSADYHESFIKEFISDCFAPLISVIDEYATACDEVISAFVRVILRLLDTITMVRSPLEVITNAITTLPSVIASFIVTGLYGIFYLITLPFRLIFHFIYYHPFATFVLVMFTIFCALIFMVIVKRISISRIYRVLSQTIAPYMYAFVRALIPIFFPQLHSVYNTVRLILTPFIVAFSFIISMPNQFVDLMRNIFNPTSPSSNRRHRTPSPESDDSDEDQQRAERLMCCVCMLRDKSVLLQPCNHICLCSQCCEELMSVSNPHCPLCRTKVRSSVDVYI